MNSKLYIGNLSFDTVTADIETLFAKSGTIKSINLVKDRDTGNLKGFGFVEMSTVQEANSAVKILNDVEFMGRNIKVNIAKERPKFDRTRY